MTWENKSPVFFLRSLVLKENPVMRSHSYFSFTCLPSTVICRHIDCRRSSYSTRVEVQLIYFKSHTKSKLHNVINEVLTTLTRWSTGISIRIRIPVSRYAAYTPVFQVVDPLAICRGRTRSTCNAVVLCTLWTVHGEVDIHA